MNLPNLLAKVSGDDKRAKKLARALELLRTRSFEEIDRLTWRKRLLWYQANRQQFHLKGSEPRKAFDLFFKHYASVPPSTVQIVAETEKEIVWRSSNWCPYLEACREMGMDTRLFCRVGHERCMDSFIKLVNRKLQFSRNYEQLRPYCDFCEERIVLTR
jgi:hypothetical protein